MKPKRASSQSELIDFGLSLPEATKRDHHGIPSLRVRDKIFASVPDDHHLRIMVSDFDILTTAEEHPNAFDPFYFGKRLACVVADTRRADPNIVRELLINAWRRKAPKSLLIEPSRDKPRSKVRRARVKDIAEIASAMPHATMTFGPSENPIYQVGRKSFIFFRTPRPDAFDPTTGERYDDVIVFWVPSQIDKQALVEDQGLPFFTTSHFNGHTSVLLRTVDIEKLTRAELAEVIEDAWLSRASKARARSWLELHRPTREVGSDGD